MTSDDFAQALAHAYRTDNRPLAAAILRKWRALR